MAFCYFASKRVEFFAQMIKQRHWANNSNGLNWYCITSFFFTVIICPWKRITARLAIVRHWC